MGYSVQQVKDMLAKQGLQVKQGTIDNFRGKLVTMRLLESNQQMSDRHFLTLERVVRSKTDESTWEDLMMRQIYLDYSSEIKTDFVWEFPIILKHLLWTIEQNEYVVSTLDTFHGKNDRHAFETVIDNFVAMSKHYKPYEHSQGTDGNPVTSVKITLPDRSFYFMVGKLNSFTKEEDVYLFYNDAPFFDPMRCRYLGGGSCDDGSLLHTVLRECHHAIRVKQSAE